MPPIEYLLTEESLYSNIDHELDLRVADQLKAEPEGLCAQHAAWDFCGWVWFGNDELWHEEVWRYHALVEERANEDLYDLIQSVNADYSYR